MSTELDHIRAAAADLRRAQDALIASVRAALEAGESVTAVAEAADVTRQTVYRWRDAEPGPVRITMNTRDVLDDTMHALLMSEVGTPARTRLVAGLRASDLIVKARSVEIGIRGLTVAMPHLDADTTQAIARGLQAVEAVMRAMNDGRKPPSRIRLDH